MQVCIRREQGYCRIAWTQSSDPDSFKVGGSQVLVHKAATALARYSLLKAKWPSPDPESWKKIQYQNCQTLLRGCSQMTSEYLGVSDTSWCLCQPIISFWPAPWCFKLMMSVAPSESHWGLFWMDSLESLDFSSLINFSDDPWSLLVGFRQLFKLPLVVQCCDVICEWPLRPGSLNEICNI